MSEQINLHNLQLVLSRYEEYQEVAALGPIIPFTHSETSVFSCRQKWYWKYYRGVQASERSDALNFGTLWHLLLERLIKHFYLDAQKVESVEFIKKANEFLQEEMHNEGVSFEQGLHYEETMINLLIGWHPYWEETFMQEYEVVAVEMAVYYPTGVFIDVPYAIVDGKYDTSDFATSNDGIFKAQYVKVGKVDALLRKRETKELYILDHKTSGRVSTTGPKFRFDLQSENYGALLQWMIDNDKLPDLAGHSVVGAFWDVTSSKIKTEVKYLKSGKISQNKTGAPPSWIVARAVKDNGFSMKEYAKFIATLKYTVDINILQMHYKDISDRLSRVLFENQGIAHSMAQVRTQLMHAEQLEHEEQIAYRNTLQCMQWGTCEMANLCLHNHNANGITNNEVVEQGFAIQKPFHWTTTTGE